MLAYLNGEISAKDINTLVIDVGGVGFLCTASTTTLARLPEAGSTAKVYTYMAVREDAIDLYAFADKDELYAFKLLTSVSGVGPKMAVSILSEFTFASFSVAVAGGDFKALTKASGVGPKLAQRIVLELKDKIVQSAADSASSPSLQTVPLTGTKESEAVDALIALGYSAADAKRAVSSLNTKDMSVQDIIKISLKAIMR